MNTYDEWSRALDAYGLALGEAGLRSLHVHLSGIEYGPKGEKEHLPLKESDLDLRAIFQALLRYGCQGRLLCESPAMEDDAVYMRELWCEVSGES
jgi:deoxyribonuclease-4